MAAPSERYHRQTILPGFGPAAQEALNAACVLVVGAGGLGAPALQYLAGAGVGTIGIVDGDVVGLSNLHRQVLYATADVGRPKALVAAEKLTALNPELRIVAHPQTLVPEGALDLLKDYDLVLDATDNFAARYLINDACVLLDKPFVYGAAHQYEGHLSVFNWRGGPTYRCLYPAAPAAGEIPDCNTGGVLGMVPGIIGCGQALEAVKILAGVGTPLSGVLQVCDFRTGRQYRMGLRRNPAVATVTALQERYDARACAADAEPLSLQTLRTWQGEKRAFTLLDVREPEAFTAGHLPGARNLPLSRLEETSAGLEEDRPLVIYCQKGPRSAKAAALLHRQGRGFSLYTLDGGYDAWQARYPAL